MSQTMVAGSVTASAMFGGPLTIEAVARGLSTIGRWNGRTVLDRVGQRFSVLQHSLLCGALLEGVPVHQLYALLHDIEEVVVGDTPAHFKSEEQSELGREVRRQMFQALKVPVVTPDSVIWKAVKHADHMARSAEAYVLLNPRELANDVYAEYLDYDVVDQVWGLLDIPPRTAIDLYVDRVEQLFGDTQVKRLRSLV